MKHIFQGQLDDLEYLGKTDIKAIPGVTYSINSISESDLEKIESGYSISIIDGNFVLSDNSDIELNKKKSICRSIIEYNYKVHDQLNILRSGTTTEKSKMKTFIDNVLNEFRTNGKDSDFSPRE